LSETKIEVTVVTCSQIVPLGAISNSEVSLRASEEIRAREIEINRWDFQIL